MQNLTSTLFHDSDLKIPNQTLGIFLISFLGLFLELLFIRWIGTEIRIFAYLQNTILVACFLGLGLGMFTSSKPIDLKQSLIPMSFILVLMTIPVTRSALGSTSETLSLLSDFVIWSNAIISDAKTTMFFVITGLALTYFTLALIVDIFVPIGRILGRLMNTHSNPIWAYSINIFGSILGTWLFVALSFFYQPPFIWFLVTGILMAIFIIWLNKNKGINFIFVVTIMVLAWFSSQTPGAINTIWSPYQKLVLRNPHANEIGEYIIDVNNIGYQEIIDLSPAHISANPKTFPPELDGLSQYDLPLLFHPAPKSVLIVGAGSGNDAAGALRHAVESVTAVEIDTAIIAI